MFALKLSFSRFPTLVRSPGKNQLAWHQVHIETLATCQWVRENRTLLIQGPPGVGKTHLAAALGVKAIEHGFGVVFYRLDELLPLHASYRMGSERGPRYHDGTIIPNGPNRMWGTDATQVLTRQKSMATAFVAIDHFVGDVVGIHAARPRTRFEALEPIRQGIRDYYGPLVEGLAERLVLRHDHGPQYMSHAFQQEIAFLGIESSPSFVRAPEGNGIAERFIRTLKEQLLWVRSFNTVEELRQALLEFKVRFNRHWLLQRHGNATPAKARALHETMAKAA